MTKRIGLVGGLGPEATHDYYRGIIDVLKSTDKSLNYPEMMQILPILFLMNS